MGWLASIAPETTVAVAFADAAVKVPILSAATAARVAGVAPEAATTVPALSGAASDPDVRKQVLWAVGQVAG